MSISASLVSMDCGSTSPEAVAASVNTILITLYAGGITGLSGIAFDSCLMVRLKLQRTIKIFMEVNRGAWYTNNRG